MIEREGTSNENLPETHEVIRELRAEIDAHFDDRMLLLDDDDFILLDFEGEPPRSIERRRDKVSPLKDVAGMLRSFGYAAHAALERTPSDPEAAGRVPGAWESLVSAAFPGAYLDAAGDAPFLPRDRAELETLLDAPLPDKALYELDYEMNDRPEWVSIPLHGILSIAARTTGTEREDR